METREEKNVKWVLIVSLIMFFVLKWWYFLDSSFPYTVFDIWFFIYLINILSVILTITFAALNKTGFWDAEVTYQLAIFFFVVSMALFFVAQLQIVSTVVY